MSSIHLGDVAAVVGIVVGGHDVVELLDSGGLGDLDNPFRVPVVWGWIAGIDEHRLAVGRQQDHRLASLGIDDVDVQRVGSSRQQMSADMQLRRQTESSWPLLAKNSQSSDS